MINDINAIYNLVLIEHSGRKKRKKRTNLMVALPVGANRPQETTPSPCAVSEPLSVQVGTQIVLHHPRDHFITALKKQEEFNQSKLLVHLRENWVKVSVGKLLSNALLERIDGSDIGNVRGIRRTITAGDETTNASSAVDDDGARITNL